MKLVRNLSFLALVVLVIALAKTTPASAYGYCDSGHGNPTYYGGVDSSVSCTAADNMCDGFDYGTLCRDFCTAFCGFAGQWSSNGCNVTPVGGGQCMFDASCTCDRIIN
jgi:hypothetical protein